MAIFKCKMCGGPLEITDGVTVTECEYCGTQQTVSKTNDEITVNLFNRANNLRLKNEFDKAAEVYGKILNINDSDAEAHWGLVLCKYGIEYVEDPKTFKRVPTCHRTQYISVLSDVDFVSVTENADTVSREIYTAEAHKIAELQKSILAIVKDEKPFDVFICYKEADENGKRTIDSALANDIYYQLTREGLRVFYAAITLEDKLGIEYEPYIFAALNSAKVMLVVGTKPEYFNSVWVRNEWSRYLGIIKADRTKLLIPCYRDMDAYDLPDEFAHFQAQDMSKIGFVNDLVRGIRKVIKAEESKSTVIKETTATESNTNTVPLLKRAFIFLEDGEWSSADEYCEKVLDIDPENSVAYLGKLMCELRVRNQEGLKECAEPFDGSSNYQKVLRFADSELKNTLISYVDYIKDRNENTRLQEIYRRAEIAMSVNTDKSFKEAVQLFESIREYKDSAALAQKCNEKIEEAKRERIRKSEEAQKAEKEALERQEKIIRRVMTIILSVIAVVVVAFLVWNKVIVPKIEFNKSIELYNEAISLIESENYHKALHKLSVIRDFKDSNEKRKELLNKITVRETISVGTEYDVALKSNGTVVATGYNRYGACNVSSWKDIVSVSVGNFHTVGLKSDGTVVAVGDNEDGACNVSSWSDIVAVSAGGDYTLGLKSDGTVVAVGSKNDFSLWRDIISISAGNFSAVGLKADGTVVKNGQIHDLSSWRDIVAVSAGDLHVVGLKSDGTVVAAGSNNYGQCNVSDWSDIVAISAGYRHTIGLKSDGTVVAVGDNDKGCCDVSAWSDIVAISAGYYYTLGLKSNGTAVATDYKEMLWNTYKNQRDVYSWKDIKVPTK